MSEKEYSKNRINKQDYLDRTYDDHALPLTRLINMHYPVEHYVKKNCRRGLDVGCGWGWAIKYFGYLGVEMHGFDVTHNILKDAISFCESANLLIADGEEIPYKKDTFDFVFSWHVIEHAPHPEIFLKEIKRVLRDEGMLIIGVPNDYALDILPFRPLRYLLNGKANKIQKIIKLMTYHDIDHKREYSKNKIKNELIDAGFEVLQINSHIFAFPVLNHFLRTISPHINKRLFPTSKRILLGQFVPQQFREALIAVCKNLKHDSMGKLMLEIERKRYIFKTKEIWFSDYPFDVEGYDGVTFHACKNKVNAPGFSCEEFTTFIIDLTQDLNVIWKNMSKSSCRYGINRAKKDGVEIKLNQNYEEFYEINRSFRKNKGLPLGSERLEFMKKYGTLFVAESDGEIIGGQLYLEDENNIRWLVGASKRLEVDRERAILIGNANRLITWEAIQYAKEKGIKEFDMGGYYTGKVKDEQKERINIFKKSFGGKLTIHYIYQKDYSKIYKLAKKMYQLKQDGIK